MIKEDLSLFSEYSVDTNEIFVKEIDDHEFRSSKK